jgi:tetratricopeptide (TPR) repeat protein
MAPRLRIFVSSPGDVGEERLRAHLVIRKLARAYARFFAIEPFQWEYEPMLASKHFQDPIDPPGSFDIFILVLWSRLGAPLPEKTALREYRGIDGRAPVTGTEWEFENALKASRNNGGRGPPDLLAYRRIGGAVTALDDAAARDEKIKQYDALGAFWRRWSKSNIQFLAGCAEYAEPDEFDRRLEADLANLIERRIKEQSLAEGAPQRLGGSPFRGLAAYDFVDAPVFFGHDAEMREGVTRLADAAERGTAFLLVKGASGAGKSSVARAGLLPSLVATKAVANVCLWRRVVMRPGDAGGEPMLALARAFLAGDPAKGEGLAELAREHTGAEELAADLAADNEPGLRFTRTLRELADAEHAKLALLRHEEARLVLLIDQLDELFTRPEIGDDQRARFGYVVAALARSGVVWVIATMRSDLAHRLDEVQGLRDLVEHGAQLALMPPDAAQLLEIIRRSARAAGLTFETDPVSGVGLDALLAGEAAGEPGVLPLLSVMLDDLFGRDVAAGASGGVLTVASYRALSRLRPANGKSAARKPRSVEANHGRRYQWAAAVALTFAVVASGAGMVAYHRQQAATAQRNQAERTLATATETANSLVFDLAQRLHNAAGVPAVLVKDILDRARALTEALAKSGQVTPALKRGEAAALIEISTSLLDIGETAGALAAAEQLRQIVEGMLVADPENTDWQRDLWVCHEQGGDVLMAQGNVPEALKSYREGLAIAARLAKADPSNVVWQSDLSASHSRSGSVQVAQGDLAGALTSYRDGVAIAERLAQSDPGNAGRQRDLSVSYNKIGDVLKAQGNLVAALKSYRDGNAIFERLANTDPSNALWQRDLSVSYEKIGDVLDKQRDPAGALKSYRDGLAIRDRLVKGDPGNALWQRDLSVTYTSVGDVLKTQGNPTDALKSYRDGLAIRDWLAKADPSNALWQRDLSVSYEKIGDMLAAQNNVAEALKSYRDGSAIFERLVKADPGNASWQRDLSVSYTKIGDVLRALGNPTEALGFYRDELTIADRLAKVDPDNALWQRDLSVSHEKIGDMLVAQGNPAEALKSYRDELAIRDRLARADAVNTVSQRDLSVSYNKIGDVLAAQGNLPEALKFFRDGMAIADQLAKADPGNALWQRDLSVSYNKIGDALNAQGNLSEALGFYRDELAIADRLAKASPGNPGWQRDLMVSYVKMAEVDRSQAKVMLTRAAELANSMQTKGMLAPRDAWIPGDIARRIAELPP